VAVILTGVGHYNSESSDDFLVGGAYPRSQSWDLRTGKSGEHSEILENIRRVPLPWTDRVFGVEGPLAEPWARELLPAVVQDHTLGRTDSYFRRTRVRLRGEKVLWISQNPPGREGAPKEVGADCYPKWRTEQLRAAERVLLGESFA
jgi:hypothetical protein